MQLSIFDLDRTLIKTNISFKFYFYLYKKKLLQKRSVLKQLVFLIRYKFFRMPLKRLHHVTFRSLKDLDFDDLKKHVDIFLDKYLIDLFYMPAVLRLQKAIKENHYIAIYSSSPFFLVEPIAQILKVNEYKSSIYSLNENNKFKKITLILDGEKKAFYAKELMKKLNISKNNVSVYSDSIEDLKLFDIASNKIAVQPSRNLKKIFIKNNWEII